MDDGLPLIEFVGGPLHGVKDVDYGGWPTRLFIRRTAKGTAPWARMFLVGERGAEDEFIGIGREMNVHELYVYDREADNTYRYVETR